MSFQVGIGSSGGTYFRCDFIPLCKLWWSSIRYNPCFGGLSFCGGAQTWKRIYYNYFSWQSSPNQCNTSSQSPLSIIFAYFHQTKQSLRRWVSLFQWFLVFHLFFICLSIYFVYLRFINMYFDFKILWLLWTYHH